LVRSSVWITPAVVPAACAGACVLVIKPQPRRTPGRRRRVADEWPPTR
jgi:hypothetical protein